MERARNLCVERPQPKSYLNLPLSIIGFEVLEQVSSSPPPDKSYQSSPHPCSLEQVVYCIASCFTCEVVLLVNE